MIFGWFLTNPTRVELIMCLDSLSTLTIFRPEFIITDCVGAYFCTVPCYDLFDQKLPKNHIEHFPLCYRKIFVRSSSFRRTWGEHVVVKNCSKCQKKFLYTTDVFSPGLSLEFSCIELVIQ